jgi:putative DNA primase/helicase
MKILSDNALGCKGSESLSPPTDITGAGPVVLANGWPASWIAEEPGAQETSARAVYEAAQAYVESGLSVIPIDADQADKSPDPRRVKSWKIYQLRRPHPDELRAWYEPGGLFGLAVIGGVVSGGKNGCGLEIIDFDSFELAEPWITQVEARMPGLIARLVRVQSPRPGLHVYLRCSVFGECQKLACVAAASEGEGHGRPKKVTLIELKGEGGYCLVPPSPGRCHPSNRRYRLMDGSPPLTQVPIITPEERSILLEEARKFNRWTEPERAFVGPVSQVKRSDGNRPGDDFERRATWTEILEPHGWVLVRRRGEIEDWRRPGKDYGLSGTVNYAGSGLFYAFSTNAYPFEEGRGYSKFHAYALLNHNGDFSKAAQDLKDKGYGESRLPAGKRGEQGVMTSVLRLGPGASGGEPC